MHGLGDTPRLGELLMDWLILQSLNAGLRGRLALHAASAGLGTRYEAWGFSRLGAEERLIPNRRNNGLFHELPPEAALAFRARFHHLR